MTDFTILLIVAAALIFCIRSILRNKKQGNSSCGCGCSSCSGSCSCGVDDKTQTKA